MLALLASAQINMPAAAVGGFEKWGRAGRAVYLEGVLQRHAGSTACTVVAAYHEELQRLCVDPRVLLFNASWGYNVEGGAALAQQGGWRILHELDLPTLLTVHGMKPKAAPAACAPTAG